MTINARRYYPEGVHAIKETLVIPQRHTGMGIPGVPPPLTATEESYPASHVFGKDWASTVLLFDTSITGSLIQTQYYGSDVAGRYWNNNNTGGDTTQRTSLMASLKDIFIEGQAQFHAYPYVYNTTPPDVYGPDFVHRADGLCIQAPGFNGDHLRFHNIPGAAIRIKQPSGGQDGNYGPYDTDFCMFDWTLIAGCEYGVVDESTDGKWDHTYISGCAKDLFTSGNSTVLESPHFYGGDRGLVATGKVTVLNGYIEANRIAVLIPANASDSKIRGLDIGPGTTWNRSVLVQTHGVEVTGMSNTVRAEDATYTDIAGLEIAAGCLGGTYSGSLVVNGTSTGYIFRGHRSNLNVTGGGWNAIADARLVEVKEAVTGCDINVQGTINGGVALDLTSSNLNNVQGKGNRFNIRTSCLNGAVPILYPNGGTSYNLADGTEVLIDGVEQ